MKSPIDKLSRMIHYPPVPSFDGDFEKNGGFGNPSEMKKTFPEIEFPNELPESKKLSLLV